MFLGIMSPISLLAACARIHARGVIDRPWIDAEVTCLVRRGSCKRSHAIPTSPTLLGYGSPPGFWSGGQVRLPGARQVLPDLQQVPSRARERAPVPSRAVHVLLPGVHTLHTLPGHTAHLATFDLQTLEPIT